MIEDDESRIAVVTSWLPETCRLIAVRSAGRAIATLKRDEPKTYAGIMLDHDLQMQTTVAAESGRSGTDVVDVIISSVDRDVPILVHSMNPGRAPAMVRRLTAAGFLITYSPFAMLTALGFHRWINEVRELWEGYD
jgi:CheY-like chemotaxis protein